MVRRCLVVCLLVGAFPALASARYGGGAGLVDDPYQISNAEQLRQIGQNEADWDKSFILTADIDLSSDSPGPFAPIGVDEWGRRFAGVFDGRGHAIYGLSLATRSGERIGLFAAVTGTIRDLRLVDVVVFAPKGNWVGALVGSLRYGTLKNCSVEGGLVAAQNNVGGLVGWSDHGSLYHCSATCRVFGGDDVGGLLGDGEVSKLVGCFATGDVTATGDDVGGLVGSIYGSLLSTCHANGHVIGVDYTGGLVGGNYLSFIGDCYAVGPVRGDERVGGLVGDNAPWGVIVNAFSTGTVSGNANVGGLVGANNNPCHNTTPYGTILDSYWDIQTSGLASMCGDEHDYCENARGLTTAELQRKATFENWDFLSIWAISEHQTYPFFRVDMVGDLTGDRRVDVRDLSVLGAQWLRDSKEEINP